MQELQLRLVHLLLGQGLGDANNASQLAQAPMPSPRQMLLEAFAGSAEPDMLMPALQGALQGFADQVLPSADM